MPVSEMRCGSTAQSRECGRHIDKSIFCLLDTASSLEFVELISGFTMFSIYALGEDNTGTTLDEIFRWELKLRCINLPRTADSVY